MVFHVDGHGYVVWSPYDYGLADASLPQVVVDASLLNQLGVRSELGHLALLEHKSISLYRVFHIYLSLCR